MSNFNFLSGSSIDTYPNMLFTMLERAECYLGFSKGSPKNQWGISSLIQIQHTNSNYLNVIATSGAGTTASKFYDNNSVILNSAGVDKQSVYIVRYNVSDTGFTTPTAITNIGTLTLSYINKTWAVIQGLVNNYYSLMPISTSYNYYIQNWNSTVRVMINSKSLSNVPFYSENCSLYYAPVSGGSYTLLAQNLQKTTNMLGESFVTGLRNPSTIIDTDIDGLLNMNDPSSIKKNTLLNSTFRLVSTLSSGSILIDDMRFTDPTIGTNELYTEVSSYEGSQSYLTLNFPFIDKQQYLKFVIGSNQINSLAIWQEALPYTSVIPVADSNPPGIDISYVKNPCVHSSLFDVNGLSQIQTSEVTYVKELNNSTEVSAAIANGFTIVPLQLVGENISHSGIIRQTISASGSLTNTILMEDFHTFVVGDQIFIPFEPQSTTFPGTTYFVQSVDYTPSASFITLTTNIVIDEDLLLYTTLNSEPSNVNASITLASTTDKETALMNGFTNVLITKTVPRIGGSSPTQNVYRQLFISWQPKDSTGAICSSPIYSGDSNLYGANFNINNWKYDNGLILYLSNKLPIYRKWASVDEQFQIIL